MADADDSEKMLSKIRKVRKRMYNLAENGCDSETFDSVQKVSRRLDDLIYRFMDENS